MNCILKGITVVHCSIVFLILFYIYFLKLVRSIPQPLIFLIYLSTTLKNCVKVRDLKQKHQNFKVFFVFFSIKKFFSAPLI